VARQVRRLLTFDYPDVDQVVLVMGNLNTHGGAPNERPGHRDDDRGVRVSSPGVTPERAPENPMWQMASTAEHDPSSSRSESSHSEFRGAVGVGGLAGLNAA
jgi:hypothetical protein